ncbi:hypothetical protein [Ornithinibacillus californiensis]|uniref:hypothetical protein n=1 Tax=Ornithinibacillus californiensis TaxID=161536 RepID=UPI00064D79F8|nr:hypothetical protein [Ornithinibacillus californiensis]
MRKNSILVTILLGVIIILVIALNESKSVYSVEDCQEEYSYCINAKADRNAVKVLNGTMSTLRFEADSSFELLSKELDALKVGKRELITLDFINQIPTRINVYQKEGIERIAEIKVNMSEYSFMSPEESGVYIYEIYATYPLATTVHHYLKIKVK